MDVREAVLGRRSVRGFLEQPVEPALLRRVLEAAQRTPSGGNLQPWRVFVLSGAPLEQLKKLMAERIEGGAVPDEPEYAIYPPNLFTPYRERRFRNGEQLYGHVGIPREDKLSRLAWFARNYQFFGAPTGLFCYVDERMGPPQWADLGMYLQTVMLLLQEEGVSSCAQEAWSVYHGTVAEVVHPGPGMVLFSGMAIGYEDPDEPANALRAERAPLAEVVTFLDDATAPAE